MIDWDIFLCNKEKCKDCFRDPSIGCSRFALFCANLKLKLENIAEVKDHMSFNELLKYSFVPVEKGNRGEKMEKSKMIFRTPKTLGKSNSPVIRLQPSVASRIYEIVEQTGLTPSKVIEQMLDYIGDNYTVE